MPDDLPETSPGAAPHPRRAAGVVAVRVVISVIGGFFLIWPLGYLRLGVLGWPTFHALGLMRGSFLSAWPTLSILVFLALGWLKPFVRLDDTPLLLVAMFCGLLLTGFLVIMPRRQAPEFFYALMIVLAVVVAATSFFARRKLRVAVFAILPFVFFQSEYWWFSLDQMAQLGELPPGLLVYLLIYELRDPVGIPAMFVFVGSLAGSIASRAFRV